MLLTHSVCGHLHWTLEADGLWHGRQTMEYVGWQKTSQRTKAKPKTLRIMWNYEWRRDWPHEAWVMWRRVEQPAWRAEEVQADRPERCECGIPLVELDDGTLAPA